MSETCESATAYVIAALEAKGTATREDFDVSGMVTSMRSVIDDWDFRQLEPHTFWRIAASYLRV